MMLVSDLTTGRHLNFTTSNTTRSVTDPVTLIQWPGKVHIKGACLIATINLNFLNTICDSFLQNLKVAVQTVQLLTQYSLKDINKHQLQRYSYLILKMENSYLNTLEYVDNLILCNNSITTSIWDNYNTLKLLLDQTWSALKEWKRPTSKTSFPVLTWDDQISSVVNDLEVRRPTGTNPSQHFVVTLLGLGVAFGAGALTTSLIGSLTADNTQQDIKNINDNIHKLDKQILVTNERITILAANVSNAVNDIKVILDKMVAVEESRDIHNVFLWNFGQLIETSTNTLHSFRLSEIIISLLETGLINSDLIDVETLRKIVKEGLQTFTELEFPLEISRITLPEIIKLLKVQKIAHNNFIISIPLVRKDFYTLYTIIPHPINIESETLAVADINKLLLTNEDSYILTDLDNVFSLKKDKHLLNNIEPIFSKSIDSCEWVSYNKNLTGMLTYCNHKKIGVEKGIFTTETQNYRLIFFSEETQVEIGCPDGRTRDKLTGLHQVPLQCDVTSDHMFWPARQRLRIDIEELLTKIPIGFDATKLPIIDINDRNISNAHGSIKTLISNLPDKDDGFTFDFDKRNLSIEQVQSYTIIAYGALSILVIINSIIIGLIVLFKCKKWLTTRKDSEEHSKYFSPHMISRDSFRGLRDSIRHRKDRLKDSLSHGLTHTPSSPFSSMRSKLREKIQAYRRDIPKNVDVGINTDDINLDRGSLGSQYLRKINNPIYPAIPSYDRQ